MAPGWHGEILRWFAHQKTITNPSQYYPRWPGIKLVTTGYQVITGVLLCCSHHYRKSHESDGQAGIVQEELMAYVTVRITNNGAFYFIFVQCVNSMNEYLSEKK